MLIYALKLSHACSSIAQNCFSAYSFSLTHSLARAYLLSIATPSNGGRAVEHLHALHAAWQPARSIQTDRKRTAEDMP